MTRVQRLCDTPRVDGRVPIATYVAGSLLGDISALVAAAIRADRLALP